MKTHAGLTAVALATFLNGCSFSPEIHPSYRGDPTTLGYISNHGWRDAGFQSFYIMREVSGVPSSTVMARGILVPEGDYQVHYKWASGPKAPYNFQTVGVRVRAGHCYAPRLGHGPPVPVDTGSILCRDQYEKDANGTLRPAGRECEYVEGRTARALTIIAMDEYASSHAECSEALQQ